MSGQRSLPGFSDAVEPGRAWWKYAASASTIRPPASLRFECPTAGVGSRAPARNRGVLGPFRPGRLGGKCRGSEVARVRPNPGKIWPPQQRGAEAFWRVNCCDLGVVSGQTLVPFMSNRFAGRTRPLALLLVVCGALGGIGCLWWDSVRRSDVNFLPRMSPAEWIVYPSPVQGVTHPRIELGTVFFFNDTAANEIYPLSLHDAALQHRLW